MSRKARVKEEDKSDWDFPHYWAASWGYGPVKANALVSSSGLVVLLHLPENDEVPVDPLDAQDGEPIGPLLTLLPTFSQLLGPASQRPPSACLIIDLTPLCKGKSLGEVQASLDEEGALAGEFGKKLGRPAVRAMERLVLEGATLVACGGVAQLALKIALAPEKISRLKTGSIKQLVLIHPRVPAKSVNTQLKTGSRSERLTVLFDKEQEKERRMHIFQHVFPNSEAHVHSSVNSAALRGLQFAGFAIEGLSDEVNELSSLETVSSDDYGRSLWLARVIIEMNPGSKQFQAEAIDITAEVEEAAAKATKSKAQSTKEISVPQMANEDDELALMRAPCEPTPWQPPRADGNEVGTLIVRGNRCVLVRCIQNPKRWHGMKIPSLPANVGESPRDTAMRAACEFCDIVEEELEDLPDIPPIAMYRSGCMTQIFVFKASRPPPPGPLEDADMSDEEDYYDWYTWLRAVHVLQHNAPELAALRTIACALAAGAAAGRIPHQWGGVFGQEWTGALVATKSVSRIAVSTAPRLAKAEVSKSSFQVSFPTRSAPKEKSDGLEEYGISSFIFQSHRPLHPARFKAAIQAVEKKKGALKTLIRMKGVAWLATRYDHQGVVSLTSEGFTIESGNKFWAALPREEWPAGLADDIKPLWAEPHGDRQTELVCIGIDMDKTAVEGELKACLLEDREFEQGVEAWAKLEDPFSEEREQAASGQARFNDCF